MCACVFVGVFFLFVCVSGMMKACESETACIVNLAVCPEPDLFARMLGSSRTGCYLCAMEGCARCELMRACFSFSQ